MKMIRPKVGPARAQTKIKKAYISCAFFNTFAHLLANAALHMASALRAPLAKIVEQPLVLLLFGNFQKSVLKLHEETGKNDENEPAQVGANNGPNENSKNHIIPMLF